jgi:flagellar capping protein FliD
VGKYFQRTLAIGTTLDALKKLGLSTQSDGTLVQDAKQFAQNLTADPSGVRAALAKLGSAVDATANKELNPSGTLGDALGRLNQRTTALAAQQKALSTAAQNVAAYKANS